MSRMTDETALAVLETAAGMIEDECPVLGAELKQARSHFATRLSAPDTEPRAGGGDEGEWTYDERHDMWEAPCGAAWTFTEGGPTDNSYTFCHCCGKPIKVADQRNEGDGDE